MKIYFAGRIEPGDWRESIPLGFCQCGCGEKTAIAKANNKRSGYVKGQPVRFIHNHHRGNWKGGRTIDSDGYVFIHDPSHPHADNKGYVREHIAIACKVLGKPLPTGAVIHHVNEYKQDNRNSNFVICQDEAYHQLIHRRTRALRECGHADWRQCQFCHKWDDPKNLYVCPANSAARHNACFNASRRAWYHARKAKAQ